jgi:hypothetical protein
MVLDHWRKLVIATPIEIPSTKTIQKPASCGLQEIFELKTIYKLSVIRNGNSAKNLPVLLFIAT